MVHITNQMRRASPNCGIDVKNWDPFIKFMLTTKLEDVTCREWKQKIGRREQVPLMEFMEIRALEYQQTQGEKLRSGLMLPEIRKKQIFSLTKGKCQNCNGDHPLYGCPKIAEYQRSQTANRIR